MDDVQRLILTPEQVATEHDTWWAAMLAVDAMLKMDAGETDYEPMTKGRAA